MDNLEKFIMENRQDFDSEVPSLEVWSKIDRQLDKQHRVVKMNRTRRLLSVAAVAAMVFLASVIGFKMGVSSSDARSLSDISPEHAEMERFFKDQVREKMAQLASYQQDGFVRADIQELDAIYEDLKKELDKSPARNEDQVVQAMINNYQTKIDNLEQVLDRVKTTGQTNLKTEENEVSL